MKLEEENEWLMKEKVLNFVSIWIFFWLQFRLMVKNGVIFLAKGEKR